MKAITVKAPIAWAIFNNNLTIIRHNEWINPTSIAIHVGKSCYKLDVEKFSKILGVEVPPPSRLLLGQVVGVVDVGECRKGSQSIAREWVLSSPRPIKRFFWQGQAWIYEIPDSEIDFDISKNPILEESGYKFSGDFKGKWRVTVYPHPHMDSHYSFSVSVAGAISGNGIPGFSRLHGCYQNPEDALIGGVKEVHRESH